MVKNFFPVEVAGVRKSHYAGVIWRAKMRVKMTGGTMKIFKNVKNYGAQINCPTFAHLK